MVVISEIGDGSGAGYPSELATNSKLEYDKESADRTLVRADVMNDLASEVVAVQTELGTDAAGNKTDVKTRLAISMDNDGYIGGIRYRDQFADLDAADADASSGGEIRLSPGTETLSAKYVMSDKIHLQGSGYASVVTSSGGDIKLLGAATGGVNGLSVSNLKLDGESPTIGASGDEQDAAIKFASATSTNTLRDTIVGPNLWIVDTPGDGVELRYADRTIVHNCIMDINYQDLSNAVGRNGVAILDGDTMVLSNLIIRRACTSGIDLEPALATEEIKRIVISNCVIEDCLNGITVNSTQGGLGDVEYISISNCSIRVGDNSATGFDIGTTGIWIKYGRNVNISNCVIQGQSDLTKSGTGIYIQYSDHVSISNCTVYGCLDGVKVDNPTTAPTNGLQVTGGRYYGNYHGGIYAVNASGNTGTHFMATGVLAFNNDIGESGYHGIGADYFDYVQINNCSCYDDQGSQTQNTGIFVDNATNAIVTNNIAYGNTVAQIRMKVANITNAEWGHNVGVVQFT